MEESLINKKIKEVMDEYLFEKPPLIGVYGVDDENIKVAYLYEKDKEKLGTNMNDITYHGFKPVEHVYSILAKGYKAFYISDYVHVECWKETERTFEDLGDINIEQYHHGRRLYFEYCKTHGIDARYMSKFDKGSIAPAADVFKAYDEKLIGMVNEKLAVCSSIDSTTLKNFEYLLNEPYYSNLELGYTLENKDGMISYFPYDFSSVVLIRDGEYPFIRDLQDWGFDFETDLFNELQSGASIRFMSLDTHESIIAELEAISKAEYDPNTQEGIKKYLKYCKKSHIHVYLPKESKAELKNLYQTYEISKSSRAEHER